MCICMYVCVISMEAQILIVCWLFSVLHQAEGGTAGVCGVPRDLPGLQRQS